MPPELPPGIEPSGDPVERGRPQWPPWYAPAGFVTAAVATVLAAVLLGLVAGAAGTEIDPPPPAVTIIGTLMQDVLLMGTAFVFAGFTLRPRLWHFGLRRTRFWPAIGWAVLATASFYLFAAVYGALVEPQGQQTVAEDLGATRGTAALIVGGFVVVVMAPVAEEFFFRGFFYGALRTRFGIPAAALIAGGVFGAIHFTGSSTLSLLPILGVLGVIFCLLYEKTGSLYPTIALHAFNNAIAFSVATEKVDGHLAVSAVLGTAMVAACMFVPRLLPAGPPLRQDRRVV